MATLTIDCKDYTEQLSEADQVQVKNLQIVDHKIASLQQNLEIMQTARDAYAQALQAELPTRVALGGRTNNATSETHMIILIMP